MAFYGCRKYPVYNFKMAIDTNTACSYQSKRGRGFAFFCKLNGSRRKPASCQRCPFFKPSLKTRIKAAKNVLFWRNIKTM